MSCQTITYEEFEKQFNDKLLKLELSLKSKAEEKKIVERDIERMKSQLEALSLERSLANKDLEVIEHKYWEAKNNEKLRNAEIEELNVKIHFLLGNISSLEDKLAN